jgi:preprotein translocase subunit SecE
MSEKAAKKAKKPSFFKGVKAEFKKITWPDKTSLMKQTVAVVSVSVVVGLVIAIMDFVIQYGVNILLSL